MGANAASMSNKLGKRKLTQRQIRMNEPRCIFCDATGPFTVEHVPPLVMFRNRYRPDGLTFASCEGCNVGTRGADLVATFVSKLDPSAFPGSWQDLENRQQIDILEKRAPGVLDELFRSDRAQPVFRTTPAGIIFPAVQITANGPRTKRYLDVFAAKFSMALYREHIGTALPIYGYVKTVWFLNHNMSQQQFLKLLEKLPLFHTLQQGKHSSHGQFAYACNTDERSIVMALASFHKGLHVLSIASSDERFDGATAITFPTLNKLRPGELLKHLPQS